MKIAFVALSVRGAMGQYIDSLIMSLRKYVELHLFVPEHYAGKGDQYILHPFSTGRTRAEAFWRLLNPWLAFLLWREILQVRPDAMHLFNGEGYPWSPLLVNWAFREEIPVVVTVHDPEPHPNNFIEGINALLRGRTLKRASQLHIHSNRFAQSVVQQKVPRDLIRVIPHGSLAQRFLKHKKGNVPREAAALFFGRLEMYKGLDVLLDAGLTLQGKMRIIIAGSGALPRSLDESIRSHPEIFELHNRYLNDDEVAQLFERASVCVLPYRQATQSAVPLIAAAFGVPVVASALGGFLDDVPRVGGILVPAGDPRALAAGMLDGLTTTPRYPQDLEFPRLVDSFLDMYEDAIDGDAWKV